MSNAYRNMTVRELAELYFNQREKKWTSSSPRGVQNVRGWKSSTTQMLEFFGDKTLGEICEGDELRNLCHRYIAARDHLTNGSLRKHLAALRSPLRWAWEQRWITGLPPMYLPPVDKPRDRKLSDHEMNALLEAAASYPTERHLNVFVHLAAYTPAHNHSILGLTWNRVNFDRGTITFQGRGDSRSERKELVVPMPDALREVLEVAASVRDCDFVVSWRGEGVDNVYHSFRALTKRVGLHDITSNDLRLWDCAKSPDDQDTDEGEDEDRLVISYCTKDGMARASSLCEALEEMGIACWIAPRDMKGGAYSGQIIEAIEGGSGLIVVLTPKANESPDVLQEVDAAKNARKLILPVIVNGTTPAPNLRYYLAVPQQTPWTNAATVASHISTLIN